MVVTPGWVPDWRFWAGAAGEADVETGDAGVTYTGPVDEGGTIDCAHPAMGSAAPPASPAMARRSANAPALGVEGAAQGRDAKGFLIEPGRRLGVRGMSWFLGEAGTRIRDVRAAASGKREWRSKCESG
jgi:hypothetical protein